MYEAILKLLFVLQESARENVSPVETFRRHSTAPPENITGEAIGQACDEIGAEVTLMMLMEGQSDN